MRNYNKLSITILFLLLAIIRISAQAPAGVSANLRVWMRAHSGTSTTTNGANVTTWTSQSPAANTSNATPYPVPANAVPPTYNAAGKNFWPALRTIGSFYSGLKITNAFTGATPVAQNFTYLGSVSEIGRTGSGYLNSWVTFSGGGFWAATGSVTDNPYLYTDNLGNWSIYSGTVFAGGYAPGNPIAPPLNVPYIFGCNYSATAGATSRQSIMNGRQFTMGGSYTTVSGTVGRDAIFMGDGDPNTFGDTREMQESIIYDVQLNATDLKKVNSYLALKYGTTLLQPGTTATDDHVISSGTEVWDKDATPTFNNNIFGIGFDSAGALNVRISKSQIVGDILTASTSNDFTSSNIAGSRVIYSNNHFYVFGNNGITSNATTAVNPATCPALAGGFFRSNKKWRVQETGTPEKVYLEVDLNAYTLNSDISLIIAEDSNFTTNAYTVPNFTFIGGKAVFIVDFKPTDKFFAVVGKVAASPCPTCSGGTGKITSLAWYLPRSVSTANQVLNYPVGTPQSGAMTANLRAFTGNTGVEWRPTLFPYPYGAFTWLERYDVGSQTIPYTTKLSQAADKLNFQIGGIGAWGSKKDVVEVKGFCSGAPVTPKVTPATTIYQNYKLNGTVATGTVYSSYLNLYTMVDVSFDKPVDSIRVEWKANPTTGAFIWSWLFIGDMSFKCKPAIEPNPDNVNILKSFDNDTVARCNEATMRLLIKNTNCTERRIKVYDTLPVGLEFVAGSYKNPSDTLGTAIKPIYSGRFFSLDSITIPAGEIELIVNLKSTNPLDPTQTYLNQARYTVTPGSGGQGISRLSDDYSSQPGLQVTPITFKAATPVYVPDITITALKEPGSCGPNTYTVTVNNTSGSSVTDMFWDVQLNPEETMVASSISNLFGGTADPSSYGGQNGAAVEGMTFPNGVSIFTFQTNSSVNDPSVVTRTSLMKDPASSECALSARKEAAYQSDKCQLCQGANSILKPAIEFYKNWLPNSNANGVNNIFLAKGNLGDTLSANIALSDAGAIEYVPGYYPYPWGKWLCLRNYTDKKDPIVYTTKFSKPVKANFEITGINNDWWSADSVVVLGFKCGSAVDSMKITKALPSPYISTFDVAGNTALGKVYCCYDGFMQSTARVNFVKPVDSIRVIWKVSPRTYKWKQFQTIWISDMNITCAPAPPDVINADNVYVYHAVNADTISTCDTGTLKITINNRNCTPKTISLTNTLPTNLAYVAGSYSDAEVGTGLNQPTYSGTNFSVTGLVVPSGESNVYVRFVNNAAIATPTPYKWMSSYTAPGAGTSDFNNSTGANDSTLVVFRPSITAKPLMTLSADKDPGTCGVRTYTVTINNTTGAPMTNALFETDINPSETLVASSVSNLLGGSALPASYGGESKVSIIGMTIPTGISTFTFQVNSDVNQEGLISRVHLSRDPMDPCALTSKVTASYPDTACSICQGGSFILKSGAEWHKNYLTNAGANSMAAVTLGSSAESGPITARFTLSDPNNVEYIPTLFPRLWGNWLQLSRYDNNKTAPITFTTKLNKPGKVNFQITGINSDWWRADSVVVRGFKCGKAVDSTKVTSALADTNWTTHRIKSRYASAGRQWWALYDLWLNSTVNVNMGNAVDSIVVTWKVNPNLYNFKSIQNIFISPMNVTCAPPPPAVVNDDNVYMYHYLDLDTLSACDTATLKLLIDNRNCVSKTVSIANNLPSGLAYVAGSYSDGELGSGQPQPTYSGTSFALNNVSVPSGESYVYLRVAPSAAIGTATTFAFRGTYTAPSAGFSDGNANTSSFDSTKLTYTPSAPVAMPTVTKASSKASYRKNDILIYTVTFNNTSGAPISGVFFEDQLDDSSVYKMATLSSSFGGTVNLASDSNYLYIQNMTIPTGSSTLNINVATKGAAPFKDTLHNYVRIYKDPSGTCSVSSIRYSNTTKVPFSSGPDCILTNPRITNRLKK